MNTHGGGRSTAEKLALFRACFSGLTQVYGTFDLRSGRALQVKESVTDRVILRHLQGIQPYGVYLLNHDRTRAAVVDFDTDDTAPAMRFLDRARDWGLRGYLERSKRRGWHVWLFTAQRGVSAAKVRRVALAILTEIGEPRTEVFPKQNRLAGGCSFGNFIHAPLFGAKVAEGRTVYVDPESVFVPYADQWQLLAAVERVTESRLDAVLRALAPITSDHNGETPPTHPASTAPARTFGLPPCARRMLMEGVTEYQRIACFRLALHLKKAGLSKDMALICLRAWATKNRPTDSKRIITPDEIDAQVRAAYQATYRGCGCEEPAVTPFCAASCPVRRAESPQHSLSRPQSIPASSE